MCVKAFRFFFRCLHTKFNYIHSPSARKTLEQKQKPEPMAIREMCVCVLHTVSRSLTRNNCVHTTVCGVLVSCFECTRHSHSFVIGSNRTDRQTTFCTCERARANRTGNAPKGVLDNNVSIFCRRNRQRRPTSIDRNAKSRSHRRVTVVVGCARQRLCENAAPKMRTDTDSGAPPLCTQYLAHPARAHTVVRHDF